MAEGNPVSPIPDGTVHQGGFESITAGLNLKVLKNTEKSNSWISPPDSVLPGWGADAEPDCRVMVFNIKGSLMARIHMRIFSFIGSMAQNFWIMMKLCHSLCCMEPCTRWASDRCWLILTVINLSLNPSEHLLMRNPVLPCHCE